MNITLKDVLCAVMWALVTYFLIVLSYIFA